MEWGPSVIRRRGSRWLSAAGAVGALRGRPAGTLGWGVRIRLTVIGRGASGARALIAAICRSDAAKTLRSTAAGAAKTFRESDCAYDSVAVR